MVRSSMSEAVIRMLRLANLNPDTVDLINRLCDKEGTDVDGNYDLRGFTPTQKPIAFCDAVAKKCVLHLDMDSLYYAFAYSDEQLVTFEFCEGDFAFTAYRDRCKYQTTLHRHLYPIGTQIRLLEMLDEQAPPCGTLGTVTDVDDIGTVFVKWDTGSSIGLIPEKDKFEVVKRGD